MSCLKVQTVSISGFARSVVSVASTQLCHGSTKADNTSICILALKRQAYSCFEASSLAVPSAWGPPVLDGGFLSLSGVDILSGIILCWGQAGGGVILCIAGCLAASLASLHL